MSAGLFLAHLGYRAQIHELEMVFSLPRNAMSNLRRKLRRPGLPHRFIFFGLLLGQFDTFVDELGIQHLGVQSLRAVKHKQEFISTRKIGPLGGPFAPRSA